MSALASARRENAADWVRLVSAARTAAADPADNPFRLVDPVHRAEKWQIPSDRKPDMRAFSAFRWWLLAYIAETDLDRRRILAPALAAQAEALSELLDLLLAPPVPARPRADLDG